MNDIIPKKGKLIIIDGTDGSGKATQTKLIKERLSSEGIKVESLDFPRYYDNFFGKFVGECMRGDYGNWAEMDPKVASVIYACDRLESKETIINWLESGFTVIIDRYVSSNQIHQGSKIKNDTERNNFMKWLEDMEYGVMSLPVPDAIIYLDVPISYTKKLLKLKSNIESKDYLEGKKDAHESNTQHLINAHESGMKLVKESNNWVSIDCVVDNELSAIEVIHEKIYAEVSKILEQ